MTDKPQKCFFDLRNVPADAYRLADDGRKWLRKCQQRRSLAIELAGHANPDGSNITIGVEELSRRLAMAESTVRAFLLDLIQLKLLINEKQHPSGSHGPRKRRLNVSALSASGIEISASGIEDVSLRDTQGQPPGYIKSASGIEDVSLRDTQGQPPGYIKSASGIEGSASGIEGSASGIAASGIDDKQQKPQQVTTNPGGPTALPIHTDIHTVLTEENSVVGGDEGKPAATVADMEDVLDELETIFSDKFEIPLQLARSDKPALADKVKSHGKEIVINAWKLYLRDHEYEFTGANRTKVPLLVFLQNFNHWKTMLAKGRGAMASGGISKEQMAATELMWKHNWCTANPGHEVIDGQIVETEARKAERAAEEEPASAALFEDLEKP